MRFVLIAGLALSSSLASAQESPDESAPGDAAIERGLAFLATDALAWKKDHNCASCHHAALIVWSMREAKGRGHVVDETLLAELTKWMAESGEGKTGVARPESAPKAFNTKAVFFALALAADPAPDEISQAGRAKMLKTIEEDQLEDGSWQAWPETRPPIFGGSHESMSLLATLALLPAADAGDEAAKSARDKAIAWLSATKSDDDPQSTALRLVMWVRLGRPAEEIAPIVQSIKDRQNADGGWSQANDMPSDAWATGQALYALGAAGVSQDDMALARGREFLVTTQRDDGGWPMTSRPAKPGAEGAKNLVPISGAGSAWAVMGLVRSQ